MAKHGFARNLDWQLMDEDIGNSLLVYQLEIKPELCPEWPHAAIPELVLDTGAGKLVLQTIGFDQWMVWNPGEKGGVALQDLPEGDWQRFICVEPVRVARPVLLAPGEAFEGTWSISCGSGPARD